MAARVLLTTLRLDRAERGKDKTRMNDRLSAVMLGLCFLACGAPVEDDEFATEEATDLEEIGVAAQALSSSCGTSSPDYSYTGSISPTLITNSGSGCTQIVDINSINLAAFLPPVLSPASFPTNEADCLAARARMYIWDKTASGAPVFLGSSQTYGAWNEIFGQGQCDLAHSPPIALVAGRSYRFGVSTEKPAFSYINLNFRSPSRPQ